MIHEVLSEGAENARTSRELCAMLHIGHRDLTQAIERERRQGHPICASSGSTPGYYLAANQEEMTRYCNSLLHRLREISETRRACLISIGNLPE